MSDNHAPPKPDFFITPGCHIMHCKILIPDTGLRLFTSGKLFTVTVHKSSQVKVQKKIYIDRERNTSYTQNVS